MPDLKSWMGQLMNLRSEVLEFSDDDLIIAHGQLVAVMCAAERIRGRKECGDDRCAEVSEQTDRLIRELRESDGPL
jgi:hypothetical protein